jgi:hypothetical protein
MKTTTWLGLGLLLLLIINGVLWMRLSNLHAEIDQMRTAEAEYELADPMAAMQRFADKLYFAGLAGNWPLAAFYLHELEEKAEEILQQNLVEEGVPVNPLITSMLRPALVNLDKAVEQGDELLFRSRYEQLVASCNACHEATAHRFIRMTVPERSMFQNQEFGVIPPP